MGMGADVLMFGWNDLVDQIVDNGCNNRHIVEEVLQMYGEKICDKYVILLDDHREVDPMTLVCHTIETVFSIEDCFGIMYDIEFDYICGAYTDSYDEDEEKLKRFIEIVDGDKHER